MKQTTLDKMAEFAGFALNSMVHGRETSAYVWGMAAAHYGNKALAEGAWRSTWGSWTLPRKPWGLSGNVRILPAPEDLVCHNPGCRGASLCLECRAKLERYGEPGR